ncbi:2-5A-dependent ribonuclease-like [Carcharodon carcharias]|uniref:2-5A-dependent ribonuclease-like n=1 Tax=Carcharodon carcharias TaxID=13397 RepID=UPI001B7F26DD|nr:2-5A-dependent ribonuclease-like [Carcharodon carcharias]XP_041063888.1 2-5A-dependent ribonuclease-like [Carcharodon carcharias]XP_041063889.1 2-5A-dependent ribonuclease-like [Carcharodon carcharias]XP_041063890.1 2-5A-dependent ribonuclease-like [Carcharodon carcharias]XP_041063891.1 2-5A-dependent ribonuclease-like [Carcharodon carcharias]XP_041063892.1 2-5A-dependent ribonuclease-like [Carcharodon carcharias]XP_041063893.1 2-5A-dependent ribonuclease-like [Carcharodon carcharias]
MSEQEKKLFEALYGTELGKKLRDLCESRNPGLSQVERLIEDGDLKNFDADMFGAALCLAATKGHVGVAKLLLSNEANVNYKMPDNGWTPLLNAVQAEDENIIDLLLQHGADPGLRKKNGATPFIVSAITGNVNLIGKFLTLGADVNETDDNGFTAFMEAAQYGNEEALRFLFQKNAEVNKHREVSDAKKKVGKGGKTALMDAVAKGHESIVDILLDEMHADVNAPDNLGKTALIHALEKDSQAIVETLLKHGADVNIIDKNRNTPLSTALTKSTLSSPVMQLLMQHTHELNVRDINGKTPLVLAVEKKISKVVELLLKDQGTEINAQDNSGRTALIAAVESKDISLTKMLCEKGADVSCADNSGITPLMIARRNYDNKTANVLIKYEAGMTSNIRPPSRWKEHSVRWHETLGKLQVEHRAPTGKLKLSRNQDFKITKDNITEVYLGFYNNVIEVAVKCHRNGSEEAKNEMDCLRDPTINGSSLFVNLLHWESDEFCDYLCLNLYEYNLEECVTMWPKEIREKAPKIMKQLVDAVQVLHGAGFAHRDLHPTNVLRDVKENFRLADFDRSVNCKHPAVTISGKATWEASEILQKLELWPTATFEADELFKADLQALGRLLHYVMTGGKDPCSSENDLCENNLSLNEDLCEPKNAEARDFIERLLAPAEKRATLSEIRQHPLLWKDLGKSQFVQGLANENGVAKRDKSSPIVLILNEVGNNQERSFHKWTEKVHLKILNNMNKRQRTKYEDNTSDLLKFIRNLTQHFDEKEELHSLIKSPESYFCELFPDLTIATYNAVKDTEWVKHFPKE